jgi:uncharacterized protein YdbL (DUF1318 family)
MEGKLMNKIKYLAIIPLLLMGCAKSLVSVNVEVVDEKTLLERQVLGSYEELGKDLVLIASVRSVDTSGKLKPRPMMPPGKKRAVAAMQGREFNRDDVERFKGMGAVGENNEGLLTYFETEQLKKDEKLKSFVQAIIKEENEDRLVIMDRIIETNENFKTEDLPKVRKIFANLNRDNAKPGELVQTDDGKWVKKGEK